MIIQNNDTTEKWFIENRWGQQIKCPKYKSHKINPKYKIEGSRTKFRCRNCQRDFSVTVLTRMHGTKTSFKQWALLIYHLTTGVVDLTRPELENNLGLSKAQAWKMIHIIWETFNDSKVVKRCGFVDTSKMIHDYFQTEPRGSKYQGKFKQINDTPEILPKF